MSKGVLLVCTSSVGVYFFCFLTSSPTAYRPISGCFLAFWGFSINDRACACLYLHPNVKYLPIINKNELWTGNMVAAIQIAHVQLRCSLQHIVVSMCACVCVCVCVCVYVCMYVKVKQSHNRPGVAQRVPAGLGFQISWHSARKGGEVVSLTHRPPLPPGVLLVLIFTMDWVDSKTMVRSEGNISLKNPVTPPAIDPETGRLVAQRLNHYAYSGPCIYVYMYICMYVCM